MSLKIKLSKEELGKVKNKLSKKDSIEIDIYNKEGIIAEKWHVTYKIEIKENKIEEHNIQEETNTNEEIEGQEYEEEMVDKETNSSEDISELGTVDEGNGTEIVITEKSKAFQELLEDLIIPNRDEIRSDDEDEAEIPIEKLFIKAVKTEQEAVEWWYRVGWQFKKEINGKLERERKEKTIRTEIYDRLEKKLIGYSRKAIRNKMERAERVYKLFKGIGRDKISRMRNTSMNTIIKLKEKKGEVDELIKEINEAEEINSEVMVED